MELVPPDVEPPYYQLVFLLVVVDLLLQLIQVSVEPKQQLLRVEEVD